MDEQVQPETEQQTPMGHIWSIIFISMCITFVGAWIWHMSGINEIKRHHDAEDQWITANTERITRYRDVLRSEGKEAAATFLRKPF